MSPRIIKMQRNYGFKNFDRRFTIATELKLCNTFFGMMLHSTFHPCCRCNLEKKWLTEKRDAKNHSVFKQSLLGLFRGNYQQESDKALHWCNTLSKATQQSWQQFTYNWSFTLTRTSFAEDWLKLCNFKKVEYLFCKFEGNGSRALLKKVDQLEGLCPLT